MNPIRIEYPLFPEEVKIAEKRRPLYFEPGDNLPKKYCTPQAPVGRYIYRREGKGKSKRLYDWETKQYVVKNSVVASRPRFMSIAGNKIMRMHPQIQDRIVSTLMSFFIEKLGRYVRTDIVDGEKVDVYEPLLIIPRFPIRLNIELHTFPRAGNWDLSNLWIYNKCFEDAMQIAGVLPNDHIGYITLPGAPDFFPISREADRKMVFIISPETHAAKLTHLFYWSRHVGRLPKPYYPSQWTVAMPFAAYSLYVTTTGSPGDLVVSVGDDIHLGEFRINVGKTARLVKVEEALKKLARQCIQLNRVPRVPRAVWDTLEPYFRAVFLDQGIPVYVND